jgi:hypothetical protein
METVTTLTHADMNKVRFAKGAFAPKGQMYYPTSIPKQAALAPAIVKGIKETCRDMLAPVPIVGVKGIRTIAKKIHSGQKARKQKSQSLPRANRTHAGGNWYRRRRIPFYLRRFPARSVGDFRQ